MGHYTGHAFRIVLKPETPVGVLEMLREVACIEPPEGTEVPATAATGTELIESHDAVKEMLADIQYTMRCSSAYIKEWESLCRLTQDAEGRWLLYTKASSKHTHRESIANFLLSLRPYMDVQEGDIVFRAIYESGTYEDIFYIEGEGIKYGDSMGYWYYGDAYDDGEHPGGYGVDVDWDPPWNLARLQTLIALKKAWYQRPEGKRGPWNSSTHMTDDELHAYQRVSGLVQVEKADGSLEPFDSKRVKLLGKWAKQERDPIFDANLCPEVPALPSVQHVSYGHLNADLDGDTPPATGFEQYTKADAHGLPIRADITLQWNPPFGPAVGSRVTHGEQRYNVTSVVKVGEYILPDYWGRNGKGFKDLYVRTIMQTRYNEGHRHSEEEALQEGTQRIRPVRRRFLDKLARYAARVK